MLPSRENEIILLFLAASLSLEEPADRKDYRVLLDRRELFDDVAQLEHLAREAGQKSISEILPKPSKARTDLRELKCTEI